MNACFDFVANAASLVVGGELGTFACGCLDVIKGSLLA